MKGKLYFLSALLLLYSHIFAQQVSLETAQRVANMFLQNNVPAAMRSASATNTTTSSASVIKPIGKVAQSPVMYAVSQDNVWVLVSADERVTPILAYSDANAGMFPEEEDMPDGMIALLDWYEYQIQYLRDSTNETTTHEGWQTYQTVFFIDRDEVIVRPLLRRGREENHWKQSGNNDTVNANAEKSYNKFCPTLEVTMMGQVMGFKTLVGCVAVAMGQVMWYWQWPTIAVVEGIDNNNLIREYDWNNMPAEITNASPTYSVDMIAHILRDAGISVDMEYTVNGSGASRYLVPNALRNVFGYNSDNVLDRRPHIRNWSESLKANLQQGYPILYAGDRRLSDGSLRGHLFVIDGYTKSNAFHMNYGQDENANGYFMLDEINGEACNKYPINQSAILNVYPNYPSCNPIEISQDEVLDTIFVSQNGGGITIGNTVIEHYQEGRIYSGEYVRLTNGFHAKAGSNLHVAIKDVLCNQTISYLPKKITDTSHEIQWSDTWNVLSHAWDPEGGDDMYYGYTIIYQLGEDTLINEVRYRKLTGYFSLASPSMQEYVAALRFADDKKVFIHYDNTEYLLYDFGAQVGDTLEIFGGIDHYKDFKILPHVITGIDTLADGRLQIYSNAIIQESEGYETPFERIYPKIWIEGVGSKNGIVQNSATNRIGSGTSVLLCAYYDDDCIYTTDNPYYTSLGCVYNDPIFTSMEEVKSSTQSIQKIMYNGLLFILRDGKMYNIMGVEVGE